MPVGTVGSVKGVHFRELRDDIDAKIILGNTYHLYLRPGLDILRQAGGLHKFNGWERPILTDSGGFQVFSLSSNRKLKEEGAYLRPQQAYFPIVQGCVYPDLRREAAKAVSDFGADGNAIGGLAVGEPTEKMYEMIEIVNEILPADKPRYLMGVGTPANILEAIDRGVDMMDCVMPTRNGRNGMIFTRNGIMNMRNRKWPTTSRRSTRGVPHMSTRLIRRLTYDIFS